jgi:AcrR family transcriptional regulator
MSTRAPVKPVRRKRAQRGSGEQLRQEIINAAKELLATSANSDAVSIRAVADAVGVTSPSIYLHFADKDALIEAVVADVFAELDAAIMAAGADEEEPLARLLAYGLAYVKFAVEHPEHYRVATMELCPGDGAGQANHLDQVLAESAFTHFMATVVACMEDGVFAAGDPIPVTLELWSAAHGLASLMIAKPFLPWGERDQFADRVLRAAALGRAVGDVFGDSLQPGDVRALLDSQRAALSAGTRG